MATRKMTTKQIQLKQQENNDKDKKENKNLED